MKLVGRLRGAAKMTWRRVTVAALAATLLPGAKDQAPVPPLLIATSFFAGYGPTL